MQDVLLLYLMHGLGWFVVGVVESFVRGRSRVVRMMVCLSLGIVSGSFHLLLKHFHYVP